MVAGLDAFKGLFGNVQNSCVEIDISHLVNINGYPAGHDGYLLVAQDDNLIIAYFERSPGLLLPKKDVVVKPMICTAYIESKQDQKKLARHTDGCTPTDKIIVVNKRFMAWHRPNAIKVAQLEAQSAKSNLIGRVEVLEQATVGEYCEVASNHWNLTTKIALESRDKNLSDQCMKYAKAYKKELKKDPDAKMGLNRVGRLNIK